MVSQIVWSTISSSKEIKLLIHVKLFSKSLVLCKSSERTSASAERRTGFDTCTYDLTLYLTLIFIPSTLCLFLHLLMNSPMKWSIRFYAYSLALFVLRWSVYKTEELRQVMFSVVFCCMFHKDWASLNTIHSSPSVLCKPKHCVLQIMSVIKKSVVVLWEFMREVLPKKGHCCLR